MRLALAMAAAAAAAVSVGANKLECGVASAVFGSNPTTAATAVNTGKLSFWWNWNADLSAVDTTHWDAPTTQALKDAFVPMIWGTATPDSLGFMADHSGDVMGFNEPDLYGPPCCNCDGKQSYFPATSSGWAPLFNPASAANEWKTLVTKLAANRSPGGVQRLVSPAMANGAVAAPGVDCSADPSVGSNPVRCEGWLALFKAHALTLDCMDMAGQQTNCWDAIDAIQIHAYAKSAADVKAKLRSYYKAFQEDFEGTNGRKKKVLWLTEVAMGSSNGTARVSWFSEFFFPAFDISGVPAAPMEQWSSSLFGPFGELSVVGEKFFSYC